MQFGVTLSPAGSWEAVLAAARLADESGIEAVGFWDHYHSERPEWAMVCGWSALSAVAMATQRIRLVPMAICRLNYTTGVLAKETSMLSIISGGRFDLGIGAGDYPPEYKAWHQPFPDATTRIEALAETVEVLRRIWQGELVSYEGRHVQLTEAACTPSPLSPPRVVVGAGASRRTIQSAVQYADELNVYGEPELVEYARAQIESVNRSMSLSVFHNFDPWPPNLRAELQKWRELGVDHFFVNIGFDADLTQRVSEVAAAR